MCTGHALASFFFWLFKIPSNYVAETSFLVERQFFKPAELLDPPSVHFSLKDEEYRAHFIGKMTFYSVFYLIYYCFSQLFKIY